jgi:hypothetical protein
MLLVEILLAQLKRGPESLALPRPHDMLLIVLLTPLLLIYLLDVLLNSCLLLALVGTS